MKFTITFLLACICLGINAQSNVKGKIVDSENEAVPFANVALYYSSDTTLAKVVVTNESGSFEFNNVNEGSYFLKATFVGFAPLRTPNFTVKTGETTNLNTLSFGLQNIDEVVVTVERDMLEVLPDRIVFNVDKTINSTGTDAISLLRKAPSVNVDNNNNISVLGRSGVNVYVDGKRIPLSGDDLSNYLKNLTSDQIDKIDIITSPGAKYEAEGNAGIIDIRLKKDKSLGTNGSLSATYTQGVLTRYSLNGTGNYRNKRINVFGNIGNSVNDNFHNINSESYQNGIYMFGVNNTQNNRNISNIRLGTDFFLHKNHTIGVLVGGRYVNGDVIGNNKISIADQTQTSVLDSILIANSTGNQDRLQSTFNVNYRFSNKKSQTLNIDLDHGRYANQTDRIQPNLYYNPTEDSVLSQIINQFETPNNIQIYTARVDYEQNLGKGKLGLGSKYGKVITSNTFSVFNVSNDIPVFNETQSNLFNYDENVYAGYVSYSRPINKKLAFTAGLRAEQTLATGNLTAYLPELQEPTVELNYLNLFPNAGITWSYKPSKVYSFNYGRRINRPDYNVLNPFRNQLSVLSIEKGNPALRPEIVNNLEVGYTLNYKYTFKLAYSLTTNKITRLIGPDESDLRASFISWDNLATQSVLGLNASLPIKITDWWNSYINLGVSYLDNQADYGNGAIVDVQTFSYSMFQQHTFKLKKGYSAEISGYYSGPGVWGGVFKYQSNWSLDVGLQKKLLKEKLKARLSMNNVFNRVGWRGASYFNGLENSGFGRWDAQFVSLSLNYSFGNKNVKSRKRKTGIEDESKRIK